MDLNNVMLVVYCTKLLLLLLLFYFYFYFKVFKTFHASLAHDPLLLCWEGHESNGLSILLLKFIYPL